MTTTLLESLRCQNTHFRARFKQTSYNDLVFARVEFLSAVAAQNESLRIILMSLRSQNTHFRARFRQTSYKDLVFVRGEFLSVVVAQNVSLRIILMSYMIKY